MLTSRRLELTAAALSVGAGFVHATVVPEHLEEWWGYGWFFIVAAVAQIAFAVILVLDPSRRDWIPNRPPLDQARQRRWVYVAGILGNVALIGMYLVSRTLGIPAGPDGGLVEEVTAIGVITKAMEIGIVVCLVQLLRMPVADRPSAQAA